MSFNFEIAPLNRFIKLSLAGKLMDKSEAESMLEAIDASILKGGNNFIVNLEELEYMNSSGINVLIAILTKARNNEGDVVITGVNEKIKQLLLITKLNTVFAVTETEQEAVELLSKQQVER